MIKSTGEPKKDKDGYILLEKEFTSRGYNFKFIKDLEGGWKIYEKSKENQKYNKYELIRPKRQDAFVFHGKQIEAKWTYPGDSAFGRTGFDCVSLERAEEIHARIIKSKAQEEQETHVPEIKLPEKEFTLKEVLVLNKLKYPVLYLKIKEMVLSGVLKKVGVRKNPRGKSSDIFKKA